MNDLGSQLSSLKRVDVYYKVKKCVLEKMHRKLIKPNEAVAIMDHVKATIGGTKGGPEVVKKYCEDLADRYPILEGVRKGFELDEYEKVDDVLALFVEHLMENGDFDLVEVVMEEIKKFQGKNQTRIEEIRGLMPSEFDRAVNDVRRSSSSE